MGEDLAIVIITLLLPLCACMLVLQVNPYHALVIRGILGALAALIYALFGAADVALTEALVGTMLSITLYAVAVRSSLSLRLGILAPESDPESDPSAGIKAPPQLTTALEKSVKKHHMRLELVPYPTLESLEAAFRTKAVHATVLDVATLTLPEKESLVSPNSPDYPNSPESPDSPSHQVRAADSPYQIQTHVSRLYEIMQADLSPDLAQLTHISLT
jgi:putative multicomponent Na+:H+ antiporter subunit B